MNKVLAIVLAGGNGKRMGVLCTDIPKPMLPFGAECRVIDFTLSNCLHSGLKNIFVPVEYQKQKISAYLSKWSKTYSKEDRLIILESNNSHYLGTADAVRQNLALIKQYNPDMVIILAGDHIYKMDYRNLLDFHAEYKADITIAVKPVPIEQASNFGIVHINSRREIIDFVEKPAVPPGNLASMGIYVFNTAALIEQLEMTGRCPIASYDFGHDIIPSMIKDKRALVYEYDGYWRDIGTIDSYYRANLELLGESPIMSVKGNWPVLTGDVFRQPLIKDPTKAISNSIVDISCRIKGKVDNSILEHGVVIGNNARVINSIVMANTKINEYSTVENCILGPNVIVDKFCSIGKPAISDGIPDITVLGKDILISQYESILLKYRMSLNDSDYYSSDINRVFEHSHAR